MVDWVAKGLRAQLKTGNLLTGQLFVDLEFFADAAPSEIKWDGRYPELPTVPAPLQQITERALAVLAKIETMPLDEIADNLNAALKSVDATLAEIESLAQGFGGSIQPELVATLKEMQTTLAQAQRFMRDDAPAQRDLRATLREVSEAARAVRLLAEQLERQPESLLRGKEAP
jgi:paraquat-inducible protein B